MFDLANHGESGARPPLTHGVWEAHDARGAVRYLLSRPDVDADRIGVIGTSAGGNTSLYATAGCRPSRRSWRSSPTRADGLQPQLRPHRAWPARAARREGDISLYASARRCRRPTTRRSRLVSWTTPSCSTCRAQGIHGAELTIVERFSRVTPHSLGVIPYPSTGRYEGYQYVSTESRSDRRVLHRDLLAQIVADAFDVGDLVLADLVALPLVSGAPVPSTVVMARSSLQLRRSRLGGDDRIDVARGILADEAVACASSPRSRAASRARVRCAPAGTRT